MEVYSIIYNVVREKLGELKRGQADRKEVRNREFIKMELQFWEWYGREKGRESIEKEEGWLQRLNS